jgi:hypothetical protein
MGKQRSVARLVTIIVLVLAFGTHGTIADGWTDDPLAQSTSAEEPLPRVSECTDSGGEVVIFDTFNPPCTVINATERLRWTNAATFPHDPGDGEVGAGSADCWRAGKWHPNDRLESGNRFSAEFHFEETDTPEDETIVLRNIQADGVLVEEERICPDDTWQTNQDGDVVIPYFCHLHDDRDQAWIVVSLG